MSKQRIVTLVIAAIGVGLIVVGSYYRITFKTTQKELVEVIEENIDNEDFTIEVPESAIKEYEKASKKDPDQFPKIDQSTFDGKYYMSKRVKATGIIELPSIKVKAGVIEGVSPRELAISAGRYTTSATPDKEEGNLVVVSHVSGPVPVFENLHKIKIGDEIKFYYKGKTYKYQVTKKFVAEPTQVEILDYAPGQKIITLFTCTNKGKQRTVVQGDFVGVE